MFHEISYYWGDATIGGLVLIISLLILSACFVAIVKTLYSLLRGHILVAIKKFINSDFPGKLSVLTGYIAIAIGTGVTMVVQSSSVVTSALTPLVGIGLLSIERMYPITLGANLGTTFTAVIIAISQSAEDMQAAFHVALCHMFFNISGVILYYPLPFSRLPIQIAKFLGNTTAKYRWFCAVYMIGGFVIFPAVVFGLSTVSWIALVAVAAPVVLILLLIFLVSVLQHKKPILLPKLLRTWKFLPLFLRSLEPYDRLFRKLCLCCCCCKQNGTNKLEDFKQNTFKLKSKEHWHSKKGQEVAI